MGLAGTGRRHGHWLEARSHVSCGTLSACPLQCCCCGQEHKSLDGWKAQPSDAAADADEEGFATPPCNLPIIAEEHRGTVCHHACNVAKLQHATERRDVQHKALRALHDMQHATPPVAPGFSSHVTRQVACCACSSPPRCALSSTNATLWSATRRVVCLVRRSACGDGSRDASARCGNLSVRVWSACNMQHAPWQLSAGRPLDATCHARGAARGTPRHVSHSGVACHGCDGRRRLPHG